MYKPLSTVSSIVLRCALPLLGLLFGADACLGQTIDECRRAAMDNYPLIRKYELVEKTTAITVSNIAKGWLPQVQATAQATLQSDVTAWPDAMKTLMNQMGVSLRGLSKDQYRIGIDVQQVLFDGGAIARQKAVAREQGNLQAATTEVDMYSVQRRVNEMYFSLLLLDDQIQLSRDLQTLLETNEKKLSSMVRGGTAAQSDMQNVRAERLAAQQRYESLKAQRLSLARLLSAFCGIEVTQPVKPAVPSSADGENGLSGMRPELKAIAARLRLADAEERLLDTSLLPRLGLFAQGFYGYPGLNMFEDMMHRQWSWNGIVGARLTWNIGALYTRHNDKQRIALQRNLAENSRDVFVFNNRLEQLSHDDNIARYKAMQATDDEIIQLRTSVRRAAESKLSHGIIDVGDLLREINSENAARLQASTHEIELLKEYYDKKYTTNN